MLKMEVGEEGGVSQLEGVEVSVGEKRKEGELEAPVKKKGRIESGKSGVLKRVAEIVLVLSSMGKMRGGKKPTEVEIGLMKEAREKLVEVCEGLAPKDIVGREEIGAVIEDLGLNGQAKDQRSGFRGPRLTIAEKFSQTKKKVGFNLIVYVYVCVCCFNRFDFSLKGIAICSLVDEKVW